MQITIIGYIAFLITLLAFIKQKAVILLYSAIFFSGFSGSSVINIGDFSIQPSFYFLIIYLPIFLISYTLKRKTIHFDGYYLLFISYCCISILFPLLLESENIVIMKQDGDYGISVFSISQLSHIVYLLLGFLLFTVLSQKGTISIKKAYKYYRFGVFAVIYICLYQIIAFKYNLPFDIFFRQGVHGNIQGSRLYGPCDEASMLCYFLAPSLFLLWLNRKNAFDIINIALGVFIGIYSYSSTFLIGVAIVGIIEITKFIRNILKNKHVSYNTLFIFMLSLIIITIVLVKNSSLINTVFEMFSSKIHAQNKSGTERISSFTDMAPIGFIYPFGIGFGSSRSKDLLSTWLCNIGIIGIIVFIILQIHILKLAYTRKKVDMVLPYFIVVILMMISVPEPYNLFINVLLFFGINMKSYTTQNSIVENSFSKKKSSDFKQKMIIE